MDKTIEIEGIASETIESFIKDISNRHLVCAVPEKDITTLHVPKSPIVTMGTCTEIYMPIFIHKHPQFTHCILTPEDVKEMRELDQERLWEEYNGSNTI